MYVVYGNQTFAAGEVGISVSKEGIFVDGMSKSVVETYFCEGQLHAADAAALTTAINLMNTKLAVQGGDFGLYEDSGAVTSIYRRSRDCLGGMKVIGPPAFSDLTRGQYTTFVNYNFTVQGEVLNSAVQILSWHEDLTFSGGGPRYLWQTYLQGPPQRQLLHQQTPYMATQSGSAVGFLARPVAPPPMWPGALLPTESQTSKSSPKRMGPVGQPFYTEFAISWAYAFASSSPLFGEPRISPQR